MSDALVLFDRNDVGRDFVVGDIHGCFDRLDAWFEQVAFDGARDRLFSVGDLIDRGPESPRALTFLEAGWFHAIRGNHEQMLLDAVRHGGRDRALWYQNGGDWFDGLDAERAAAFVAYAEALPLAIEIECGDGARAALVHAQLPAPDWDSVRGRLNRAPVDTALASTLLWERLSAREIERRHVGASPRMPVRIMNIDTVYHGHTPMPAPIACENTRWIDTGAFMGRPLAIAKLADDSGVWMAHADRRVEHRAWSTVARDPTRD